MSVTFLSFADGCRIGKKRKSEENDQMLTAEQNRKLAKTQVSDKVNCVNTTCNLICCLIALKAVNSFWDKVKIR